MSDRNEIMIHVLAHKAKIVCDSRLSRILFAVLPFVSLLLLLLTSSSASAQIDYRVDNRVDTRPGRLFEANPMVGSGGANRASRFGYDYGPGIYANQIITGNVSGLGGFHGQGVIPSVNQFRVGLQSDALSSFRAQSVGIQDVQNGRTFASSPYYDPSTSIADLGAIRSGLNQPGSSFLASPNVVPSSIRGYTARDRLLGIDDPTFGDPTRFPLYDDYNTPETTLRTIDPSRGAGSIDELRAYDARYRAVMQSTLFGTPSVDNELGSARPPLSNLRLNQGPFSDSLRDHLLGIEGVPSNANKDSDDPANPSKAGGATDSYQDMVSGLGTRQRPLVPTEPGLTGEDLYSQMTDALSAVGESGPVQGFLARQNGDGGVDRRSNGVSGPDGSRLGNPANGPSSESDSESVPGRDGSIDPTRVNPAEQGDRMYGGELTDTRRDWARRMLNRPIRSLAVGGDTTASRYMRSAEEALKKGEFMHAAGLFDLASTVDNQNPLAQIGRGNALIAAGQYMSAVAALESGIRLFPEIAAFELDLVSLTGQPDVFDQRRADLEKLLEVTEQYELRFLLGYIELYSGLHYDGLNDLEKAASNAPPGSAIARFPDLLLGRRPTDSSVERPSYP